ncbi:MAG: GNAT family N-acetyltransferase [Pirellulaceae bacterium]
MITSRVDPAHFASVARWLHRDLPASEFAALIEQRHGLSAACPQPPMYQVTISGTPVVAAYFNHLPGSVATLGGVRANAGQEPVATELIRQLMGESRTAGIEQIQAVMNSEDKATQQLVAAAGMRPLTVVQHQWADLATIRAHLRADTTLKVGKLCWQPATEFARCRMAKLIVQTFIGTLDCPQLNGLRSETQVLDGFLGGRALREQNYWEILRIDGLIAGCVLLSRASANVAELVYMALLPEYRGQRMGNLLIQRGLELSQRLQAEFMALAVDENNWPALRLYANSGFRPHCRLAVCWLPPANSW